MAARNRRSTLFCVERIDAGTAKGLTPGVHPEATPACVNSCIAKALTFGDIDDPQSSVARAVAGNAHFRMHEELGTGPRVYYLYDGQHAARPEEPQAVAAVEEVPA